MDSTRQILRLGSIVLIVIGVLHAVKVARGDPLLIYWWLLSLFLIAHGATCWLYLSRRKKRYYRNYPEFSDG